MFDLEKWIKIDASEKTLYDEMTKPYVSYINHDTHNDIIGEEVLAKSKKTVDVLWSRRLCRSVHIVGGMFSSVLFEILKITPECYAVLSMLIQHLPQASSCTELSLNGSQAKGRGGGVRRMPASRIK